MPLQIDSTENHLPWPHFGVDREPLRRASDTMGTAFTVVGLHLLTFDLDSNFVEPLSNTRRALHDARDPDTQHLEPST